MYYIGHDPMMYLNATYNIHMLENYIDMYDAPISVLSECTQESWIDIKNFTSQGKFLVDINLGIGYPMMSGVQSHLVDHLRSHYH